MMRVRSGGYYDRGGCISSVCYTLCEKFPGRRRAHHFRMYRITYSSVVHALYLSVHVDDARDEV